MFSKSMSPLVALWKLFGVANPEFITLKSVPWIMLVMILWEWTGFTSLVIYSALVSIPREYAEAAEMDGATWLKVAYYIKVPLLRNTVFVLFIFNIFGAMQVFNEPRMINVLFTLPMNYTPAMYVYNQAFAYGAFTYAIAMGRGHVRRLLLLHETIHEGTGRPCVICIPSREKGGGHESDPSRRVRSRRDPVCRLFPRPLLLAPAEHDEGHRAAHGGHVRAPDPHSFPR
jgi:hypothetical protein